VQVVKPGRARVGAEGSEGRRASFRTVFTMLREPIGGVVSRPMIRTTGVKMREDHCLPSARRLAQLGLEKANGPPEGGPSSEFR